MGQSLATHVTVANVTPVQVAGQSPQYEVKQSNQFTWSGPPCPLGTVVSAAVNALQSGIPMNTEWEIVEFKPSANHEGEGDLASIVPIYMDDPNIWYYDEHLTSQDRRKRDLIIRVFYKVVSEYFAFCA